MKKVTLAPRAKTLGTSLREAREARGFGLRETARALDLAVSLLAHWERGTRTPSTDDVANLLGYFRVVGRPKIEIMNLARNARDESWLTTESYNPHAQIGLVQCDTSAISIKNWQMHIVPGLLQTSDYAYRIYSAGLPPDEIERRLAVRMSRQKILTGNRPVKFTAILGEAVLTEKIADDSIMSDQMDHLLAMSERPNITIRVLRHPQGEYHPGIAGSFMIWEYENMTPHVLLENHRCSAFLSGIEDGKSFLKLMAYLESRSLSEEASREMIASYTRQPDPRSIVAPELGETG